METWEYFTTTFESKTKETPIPLTDDIPPGPHPKYSVYTLIPQLNEFGARGWELVSLDPVQKGRNGDLRLCDASSDMWTYTYFASFKRRTIPGFQDGSIGADPDLRQ